MAGLVRMLVILLLLFVPGCARDRGGPEGQLIVAVSTDLEVPKDLDSLRVQVWAQGSLVFEEEQGLGSEGLRLPTVFSFESGRYGLEDHGNGGILPTPRP